MFFQTPPEYKTSIIKLLIKRVNPVQDEKGVGKGWEWRGQEGHPTSFSPVTFAETRISLVNNSKLLSLLTLRIYLHTGNVKLWFNRCINWVCQISFLGERISFLCLKMSFNFKDMKHSKPNVISCIQQMLRKIGKQNCTYRF